MEPRGADAPGRLEVGRPIAVIDIGSNSVRLVAYEGLTRAPTPIYNEKVLCALGRHVATTGRLDEDGMARAVAALKRFRILCRTMDVGAVQVLATAAARDAQNGKAFLEAASEAVGLPIELLSGAREAELSALGVISGFYGGDGIVGDLGGGSLELIDVRGGRAGTGITLPIGGLALLDLSGNSPRKAQRLVREALEGVAQLKAMRDRTFYAVGGTWRALARLHMAERNYPLRVMHGYRLPPEDGIDFLKMVERTDAAVLKEIEAVSEARRPLLAYGAIVLEEIIRLGRPRDIAISALGVREGLLFERLDDARKAQDPLLSAAQEFNHLRSRSPAHNVELIGWTDRFFASARLDETAEERRLRHAACLLADIGWRAHPDYRGDQSVNLIANANFIGIDHPGRAFLSLAIFHRHEGLGGDKAAQSLVRLAGSRLAERARLLGGAMRVAYPVSVAMAGTLPRAPLEAKNGALVLSLPEDLGELAGERLVGRMRQLARITGLEPRILIG